MSVLAHSVVSTEVGSFDTGTLIGKQLLAKFETPPVAIIAYTTINHDHAAFLSGLTRVVGSDVLVVGCSSQGVMTRGSLLEAGYIAGAMAIGGAGVCAASAMVPDIHDDPRAKGRALGVDLLARSAVPPKAVVIYYDPLCAADVGALLDGLHEVIDCPVVGGGAGQTWGPMSATFQFLGESVHQRSAIALALGGEMAVVVGACHGTTPVGIGMKVTRSAGTSMLELDGRRASEVWTELTGENSVTADHQANMAVGLPDEEVDQDVYRVLAPFGVDRVTGGITLQASLQVGTEIMFHHRTEESVLAGTATMARQVRERLGTRTLRAVLGFECAARTASFLGRDLANREQDDLQSVLGRDAEWLGMLAWGEVFPLRRGPAVFNYTFPILCLTD